MRRLVNKGLAEAHLAAVQVDHQIAVGGNA